MAWGLQVAKCVPKVLGCRWGHGIGFACCKVRAKAAALHTMRVCVAKIVPNKKVSHRITLNGKGASERQCEGANAPSNNADRLLTAIGPGNIMSTG